NPWSVTLSVCTTRLAAHRSRLQPCLSARPWVNPVLPSSSSTNMVQTTFFSRCGGGLEALASRRFGRKWKWNLRKLFIPFELKLKPAVQSNLGTDYEFLEVCGIRSLPQFLKLQRTDRDLNEETLYE